MQDIWYQAEKKDKVEIDLKSVIFKKYHNFFIIFSKKDLNTLFLHWKYDYKIYPEKKHNLSHILLYNIFLQEKNTDK